MSDLELFSMPLCPFAHRVRLVLAEKELAYRLTENRPQEQATGVPEGFPSWQGPGAPAW